MELKWRMSEEQERLLHCAPNEELVYGAPYDLTFRENKAETEYAVNGYIAVTNRRIVTMEHNRIKQELAISDCEQVRCEPMIGSGILTVTCHGEKFCIARFSMKHLVRFSYIARGAELLAKGSSKRVSSDEPEKYCSRCQRALPGTRECPYCNGKMVTVKKFMELCGPYKWKLFLISCFMLISSILSVIIPDVQKRFIDGSLDLKKGTMEDVWNFVFVMLLLMLVSIVVNVTKNWWCTALGSRISIDLRRRLFRKIQTLSLAYQQGTKPGDLMNRISKDTAQIRKFLETVFGQMFSILVTMICVLTIMLTMSPYMTLASVILVFVVFFLSAAFRKLIKRMFRMQRYKEDKINSRLQDVLSGMRVVKSFGKEQEESKRFTAYTREYSEVQKKNETFFAIFYPILTFIMGIGVYMVTYFGGARVLKGTMTSGELLQFISYTNLLYGPLGFMTHLPRSIMQMITALERIYDVMDVEPELKNSCDAVDLKIQGNVTIDHISFGYKTYETVLRDLSLTVKKGEMIGIVGASGSGKSTLINLLMRLYDVDEGAIRIDGTDIRNIRQESLHSQIGVVLQETFLFTGTILNNIRFAKQDATFEEVVRAAKAANAHDFICKMPDGYNTYVNEKGHNLSGGERQRIAIARAILNDPKILILDEATSSLDTESEYMIQQALERLIQGRTTFAIAHRLSTLRNATRLIVIDDHTIAETGTHNELLEKKGIYYGLVTAQKNM